MYCETGDDEYGAPDRILGQAVKDGLKIVKAKRFKDEDGEWSKSAVGDGRHEIEQNGEPVLRIVQAFLDLFRSPWVALTTAGCHAHQTDPEAEFRKMRYRLTSVGDDA